MYKSLFIFLLMSTTTVLAQELKLPQIFNDHMVLQRNEDVRIWGWASPGSEVSITINDHSTKSVANPDGEWEAFLAPQQAGGPYTLTIESSKTVSFEDIYFGDVWLAGGQSNMEWQVGANITNMEEELNDADYPQIRFFKVTHAIATEPLDKLKNDGEWKPADRENVKNFSAVAWFFAKHNHLEKGVPVGIIDDNWGGTPAEAWTPASRLQHVEGYQEEAKAMLEPGLDWEAKFEKNDSLNSVKYQRVEDQTKFLKYGVHEADFDDSEWRKVELPNEEALQDFVWLRKSFSLEKAETAKLSFGNPGKFTVAFINGQQVYRKIWSDDPKVVEIDKDILNEGENVIAIRTVEDWNNRTFIGSEENFWIQTGSKKISLNGTWKVATDVELPMPEVIRYEHSPGTLYNAMIHPIAGFSIKGAIWYQGESNVSENQYYNNLFEAMIEEWRKSWNQGDFPFLFVQLANFQQKYDYPTDSGWARLQEAQTQTLSLANTGMAVIIDIGEANDIHPRNKKDVGYRLWQSARHVAFNGDNVYSGPMYAGHVIKQNTIEVAFDHVGGGLIIKGSDKVEGFAIAGEDKKFYWADAKIDGDNIILSAPEVTNPVAVRYAWADNPDVSLYNEEGLPAVPFRTDDWN